MGKRLIHQRRGSANTPYLSPSFKHKAPSPYPAVERTKGVIRDLIHNPGSSTPLAVVEMDNGDLVKMRAQEGAMVGQTVHFTDQSLVKPGNVIHLGSIPEGTPIYNIESNPGDGGKLARSGGNYATIISHGDYVIVKLPSGAQKKLHPQCRATVGVAAGGGRNEKPFMKAGKKHHAMKPRGHVYPTVRGVAMNPVDHPHGGGAHQHVGKPSSVSRNAPPGRKVGNIAARRTGKR
ncbi:MAG TPA: 50S ribosomal protein L2 [Thermoplasmatales archaeon]|nr:50S ribosomal protein L2 [Candidatus Thermoplasmatota archaeon]HDS59341.1 50S ribosomal protein L2 [Thermoplasmatales archaeon]